MRSTKLPLKTTTKRAAEAFADEMERTARELRGTTPDAQWYALRLDSMLRLANVPSPRKSTTWAKAAEGWLGAKTSKESSVTKYRADIAHFTRWLGARAKHDLRGVSADDVAAFYRSLRDSGLADATTVLVVRTVKSILRRATLLRYLDTNPAELLVLRREDRSSKRRPFRPDEIRRILAAADAEWKIACLFGLYYGMRLQDALRRDYSEIRDGVLRFVPQKKSRRGRVVVVPLVGDLVGLSGGTAGPITPSLCDLPSGTASLRFRRILDRAGVVRVVHKGKGRGRSVVDATFHSWRHTTNSMLVDAGVDQRVRQLVCDHDTVEMSNAYTQASVETMRSALGALVNLSK